MVATVTPLLVPQPPLTVADVQAFYRSRGIDPSCKCCGKNEWRTAPGCETARILIPTDASVYKSLYADVMMLTCNCCAEVRFLDPNVVRGYHK